LRARNQRSAVPDSWEAEVLADFEQRQSEGGPVEQLNTAALVGEEFRYMQAQATGYTAGQIRGAISLRKAIAPLSAFATAL